MKSIRKTLTLILAVALLSALFCACTPKRSAGTFTLVVGTEPETVLSVELDGLNLDRGLFSVLSALKEAGKLDYTASLDGSMLLSVGGLSQDADNGLYLWIWTSVALDADTSAFGATNKHVRDGVELSSTGVGAADMHFEDGAVIYVGTVQW